MEALENYVENHPQVTAFFTVDLQTGVLVYRVLQKKNLRKEIGSYKPAVLHILFRSAAEERFVQHGIIGNAVEGRQLQSGGLRCPKGGGGFHFNHVAAHF